MLFVQYCYDLVARAFATDHILVKRRDCIVHSANCSLSENLKTCIASGFQAVGAIASEAGLLPTLKPTVQLWLGLLHKLRHIRTISHLAGLS